MAISNPCVTFGENLNFNFDRIDQALSVIGSASAALVLRYGTWSLDEAQTIPANVAFSIPPGAVLNGAYTLTINGPFAGSNGCFGSSLTVVFGSGYVDTLNPKWWSETYLSLTKTRACMTSSGIPADLGSIADDPTTTGWGTDEKGIRWFNLDSGIWKWWDGTQILELTGGTGATDHGTLTGLDGDDHPQYILHSLATAANDFLVASGVGVFIKKTLAQTKTILGLLALAFKNTVGSGEIDDEAVTYAKMQHVSATDKVLGRSTAGAGDVEEIACTAAGRALLDDSSAAAQRVTLKINSLWISDYANLAAAITAIGATETTLIIDSPTTLTANVTIPSTLSLKILKGGSIVNASTYTLTINGPFEAGPYQVFPPTGTVVLSSVIQHYPEWYSSGIFTQSAIEAALTAIGTTNKVTLLLRPGTWVISSNADWSAYTNVTFKIVPGAILQVATGTTTTIPRMDESGMHQRFSCFGTGKVAFPDGSVSAIDPNWWKENLVPKTTDMTAAVQAAIIAGIPGNIPITIPSMMLLTASVNIDRQVDNILYNEYFTIKSSNGGGFYVNTAIAMLSSSLPFTTAPVSQLIKFDGIHFQGGTTDMAAYVLNDSRFLRTTFHSCDFEMIKFVLATIYTQSIYFHHCNIRRWTGWFFNSPSWNFDFKVTGCIVETGYGDGFVLLNRPQGSAITDNLIEGIPAGNGIYAYQTYSLVISGNYFEGNLIDINLASAVPNRGLVITGNNLSTIEWGGNGQEGMIFAGNDNGITHWPLELGEIKSSFQREAFGPVGGTYTPGLTADSSFDIEAGSAYLVTLTVLNGSNILESIGQWVVARQGTGTKVVVILTPVYFTCTQVYRHAVCRCFGL